MRGPRTREFLWRIIISAKSDVRAIATFLKKNISVLFAIRGYICFDRFWLSLNDTVFFCSFVIRIRIKNILFVQRTHRIA